jgi:3-hydroxyacyl-CoA dehydrogenase
MTATPDALSATGTVVRYERDGSVAVLRIDNPPVNASTRDVRSGLLAGLHRAGNDNEVTTIVLIGTDRAFVSGSDLREFDGLLPEPQLPEVIGAIEQCPKPVVAALSGPVLGGGFELALGCDARVGSAGMLVGLPEVGLGMIPGAGGTQRLPRLIGTAAAMEVVCSGRRLNAHECLDAGIIDGLAESDLYTFAVDFARTRSVKRTLIASPIPADPPGLVETAARAALTRGKGRPQVAAAVAAVLAAGAVPARLALDHERAEFTRLRLGAEARALRYLFFAERAAAREYRSITSSPITTVGVVGAGTMGAGIARTALEAGLCVVLLEARSEALEAGQSRIAAGFARAVQQGKLTEADKLARLGRLSTTLQYRDLARCDLVIEAVFEDFEIKAEVLKRIDAVVAPTTVIASNTSYLDLDALAASTDNPERIVGMHFFSPPHATRVVEVVHGAATTPQVTATAVSVTRILGKTAIAAGVGFGFIGNRLFNAYRRQCELMVEEGAYPHQIDRALERFGFAMGPFAVADMSGLDIAWKMRKSVANQRDPNIRYVDVPDLLCEQGRFGQKAGRGWYRYNSESTTPVRDAEVDALIDAESARKGIQRRVITDTEITDRVLLAMANEAALLLAEGIAARSSDIDLMMALGYGFPRHHGGPVYWARHQDPERLQAALSQLQSASGAGFVTGQLNLLNEGATA